MGTFVSGNGGGGWVPAGGAGMQECSCTARPEALAIAAWDVAAGDTFLPPAEAVSSLTLTSATMQTPPLFGQVAERLGAMANEVPPLPPTGTSHVLHAPGGRHEERVPSGPRARAPLAARGPEEDVGPCRAPSREKGDAARIRALGAAQTDGLLRDLRKHSAIVEGLSPRCACIADRIAAFEYVIALREAWIIAGIPLDRFPPARRVADALEVDEGDLSGRQYLDAVLAAAGRRGLDVSSLPTPPRDLAWKALVNVNETSEGLERWASCIGIGMLREQMIDAAQDPSRFDRVADAYTDALASVDVLADADVLGEEFEVLAGVILDAAVETSVRAAVQGLTDQWVKRLERARASDRQPSEAGAEPRAAPMPDEQQDDGMMLQFIITSRLNAAAESFGMSEELLSSLGECLPDQRLDDSAAEACGIEIEALIRAALDIVRDVPAMAPEQIAAAWMLRRLEASGTDSMRQAIAERARGMAMDLRAGAAKLGRKGGSELDAVKDARHRAEAYGRLSMWFEDANELANLERMRRSADSLQRAFAQRAIASRTSGGSK